MRVRLTKSGQELFSNRDVVDVSAARAYVLMDGGYAIQDIPFMSMYKGNMPDEPVESQHEDAISSKPAKAEKAVLKRKGRRKN